MQLTADLAYLGGVPPSAMKDGSIDYMEADELRPRLRALREQDIETLALMISKIISRLLPR